MSCGKVYLVGAGPGDAGLLTVRGKEVLESADVVVCDALVGPGILSEIPPETRVIHAGKRAGGHSVPQEEINRTLLREALCGNTVVRLKGGDPLLFGRGGEELEALSEHGIPFEIVPGVTSAFAVPAYAGIPVTHRDFASSVHILTGRRKAGEKPDLDYDALVRLKGTLIFLMGLGALGDICGGLLKAGMDPATPAAVLERGTMAKQRKVVSPVASLPEKVREAGLIPPAILVVGRVCKMEFGWAEKRPLGGTKIIVTRPRGRSDELVRMLRGEGADVIRFPCIRTQAIDPNPALSHALAGISRYAWAAFTSPFGVECFLQQMKKAKMDIRKLGGVRLAAIGSATARRLEENGLFVDFVPRKFCAAALGEGLARLAGENDRILLARARAGTPDLTAALDRAGVPYDDMPVYDTFAEHVDAAPVREALDAGEADYVTFTSASTVRGFVGLLGKGRDYSSVCAVCIGPATEKEAKRFFLKTIVAEQASARSMAERMMEQEGKRKNGSVGKTETSS